MGECLKHPRPKVQVFEIQGQTDAGIPDFMVFRKAKLWTYEIINIVCQLRILLVCVAGHVPWMATLDVARRDVVSVE